jgi:hypothetical protein
LCELTAKWLEGAIASQPGYAEGCGPDPETSDLIPALTAVNRAGFMTSGSQPGYELDLAGWVQRAGVEGFCSPATAERLIAHLGPALCDTGLIVSVQQASRRMSWKHAVPVTARYGRTYTRFGTRLSRRFIRDGWEGYGICHADATDALCAAVQLTIVDFQPGRNDRLWPALAAFADALAGGEGR